METVAPLVALLDRAVKLLSLRRERKKQYFDEVIKPLYAEMPAIVEDYFALFRTVEALLHSEQRMSAEDWDQLVVERSERMLHLRIKVRAMAQAISEESGDDEHLVAFARAVHRFFFDVDETGIGSHSVTIRQLLRRAAEDGDYRADRSTYQRVTDYTRKNRDRMETEWAEVTRQYARLQIEAVS